MIDGEFGENIGETDDGSWWIYVYGMICGETQVDGKITVTGTQTYEVIGTVEIKTDGTTVLGTN